MPSLGVWFRLELELLTLGGEERRRATLRAWRDRQRPRIWDRQLVIASGPPEAVERDLAALDAYYGEVGAEQWSWVGPEGPLADDWEQALVGLGLGSERIRVLARPVAGAKAVAAPIERLTGAGGLDLLRQMISADGFGALEPRIARQIVDLLVERSGRGLTPVVLALREGQALAAYVVLTVTGGMCWLEDLQTRDECRGKGYGRALLHASLGEAASLGAAEIGCSALEDDWPWQWYQREGFTSPGRVVRLRRLL